MFETISSNVEYKIMRVKNISLILWQPFHSLSNPMHSGSYNILIKLLKQRSEKVMLIFRKIIMTDFEICVKKVEAFQQFLLHDQPHSTWTDFLSTDDILIIAEVWKAYSSE